MTSSRRDAVPKESGPEEGSSPSVPSNRGPDELAPARRRPGIQRAPILPDRVRKIDGGFAFIPQRFLHEGFFASLTPIELELYFLLVIAGDRQGVSFYHVDRLCSLLQMDLNTYLEARNGLIEKDLLAYDGIRFQVLSLPERPAAWAAQPLTTREDFERRDRATIRQALRRSLDEPDAS